MTDDLLPGMSEEGSDNQGEGNRNEIKGKPRFECIDRKQMVMRPMDVDQLVDQLHPVRAIWEFTGRLDWSGFIENVRAVEGERGRPAWDPRLMSSLWLYAYSRSVSSAREIERLCEYDPAFQWLTGMKVVNHHSLSDFRVGHGAALDKLFIEILAVLNGEGLISLERVMHDGTKIKAFGSRSRYRTKKKIDEHLEIARRHVEAMKEQGEEEVTRREAKAKARAARERVERLETAQKEYEKLRASESKEKKGEKKEKEVRVSENEPEARIMKYRDGSFALGYNAQISTEQQSTVIVGIGLSQAATDYDELNDAIDRIEHNTGKRPEQLVADGGYVNGSNIHTMGELGIEFVTPATDNEFQTEKLGIDKAFLRDKFFYDSINNTYRCPADKVLKHVGKEKHEKRYRDRYRANPADCSSCQFKKLCCPDTKSGRSVMRQEHQAEADIHAAKMQTEESKAIYKQRGQTAEFPIAWIKEKLGLRRFRVKGLVKAGRELTWACLTYNIQQWIRLRWIPNRSTQIAT